MEESGIKRVTPEDLRRHFFARDQKARFGVGGQLAHVIAEAKGQRVADDRHRHRAETKEEGRLQDIDPDGAAHPAEKDVERHDHRHDGAAPGIGNQRLMSVRGGRDVGQDGARRP